MERAATEQRRRSGQIGEGARRGWGKARAVFGKMSWIVRVKMIAQALYLVEEAVLAALVRKAQTPQVF